MATLIDSVGTQHYANKMVLAENRKVGNKSLPSALADVDNLIEEMKGQFEAEYGSALDMKLENSENVFSVGAGNGVDKRDEVENSFTDVEVFGNSMINCIHERMTDPSATIGSTSSSYFMDSDRIVYDFTKIVPYNAWIQVHHNEMFTRLKPNTQYTLIIEVLENTTPSDFGDGFIQSINSAKIISGFNTNTPKGLFKTKFTTDSSTIRTYFGFCVNGSTPDKEPLNTVGKFIFSRKIMILEGDYTNKQIPPYFEGLKSVGEKEGRNEIEVLSRGKNLFNGELEQGNIAGNGSSLEGENIGDNNFLRIANGIKLSKNTSYSCNINSPYVFEKIALLPTNTGEKSKWFSYSANVEKVVKTTDSNNIYLKFVVKKKDGSPVTILDIPNIEIQIEQGNITTQYEPYKEDKKQISLNEPLRGLPNGTKDSIELVNGEWKLIRRCGEKVFNGSEGDWKMSGLVVDGYVGFYMSFQYTTKASILCDRFFVSSYDWNNLTPAEFLHIEPKGGSIGIRLSKSKLKTQDVDGFKEWLKANPTKIIYELTTPIIEDIDEVTLQCWKNGTISIDSTVPPTTTHTVALNKPAQIKRNIEELTTLRHKVKTLEEQYDQIALEQAHKLELLNHSFELDYNI